MSGAMVRAILEGRKTQTRRLVKYHHMLGEPSAWCAAARSGATAPIIGDYRRFCHCGAPGDRLWVRETFGEIPEDGDTTVYRATDPEWGTECGLKWKPSIFMPRWASRITLEIVSVRVERVQEITPEDVAAEGVERASDGSWLGPLAGAPDFPYAHSHEAFSGLWDSLNAKRGYGWETNPWVWVLEFPTSDL